jgi:predicted DNA binding protein
VDGLKYFQIQMPLEKGSFLPGSNIPDYFTNVEFLTAVNTQVSPARYIFLVEYDRPDVLDKKIDLEMSFQIEEVLLKTENYAYVIVRLPGPMGALVQNTKGCWMTAPSTLSRRNGLMWTVQGTTNGLKEARDLIAKIVPGDVKMRISKTVASDWISAPRLPSRRHEVMKKAVELGYYSTPRRCTQRDIADSLGIRQGTVAEHLQSAEGSIINSWSMQTADISFSDK